VDAEYCGYIGINSTRSTPALELRERLRDVRAAVAHRVIDLHLIIVRCEQMPHAFGLAFGVHPQRRAFRHPDRRVFLRRRAAAQRQDHRAQQHLPDGLRNFDDARIGQEFGEIAAHRARGRGVGRAEIDQQHTDAMGSRDARRRLKVKAHGQNRARGTQSNGSQL
jgi:hypothetical protein